MEHIYAWLKLTRSEPRSADPILTKWLIRGCLVS